MYIAPNSTVWLLRNVPIDPNYRDTVWYSTEAEQLRDFTQYVHIKLDEQSYVHKERGYINVSVPYASIYKCNYMMFRNTSFENKMFYAFITRLEYISNDVTRVYFRIDVLQTWLKQINFRKSFISREIPAEDTCDHWLIPENVDQGAYYVYDRADFLNDALDLTLILAAPFRMTFDDDEGTWEISGYSGVRMAGGIASGVQYTAFDDIERLNAALTYLNGTVTVTYPDGTTTQKADLIGEVVAIMLAPAVLFRHTDTPLNARWETHIPIYRDDIPVNAQSTNYVYPYNYRNRKLSVYPFMYYLVTDYAGHDTVLQPELFQHVPENTWITLQVTGDTAPNGGLVAFPRYYKGNGSETDVKHNVLEGTTMSGFPTVAWTVDTWRSWLASSGIEGGISTLKDTITGLMDAISSGTAQKTLSERFWEGADRYAAEHRRTDDRQIFSQVAGEAWAGIKNMLPSKQSLIDTGIEIGGAVGVLNAVTSNLGQVYQQKLKPNTVVGTQCGGARIANNMVNLSVYHIGLGIERAKELDTYFDMYGYATNRFGVPDYFQPSMLPSARPYRYFVQTNGADITGEIPADDLQAIAALFDNGLRFWKGYDEASSALANVGNYNLDNSSLWV